MTNAAWEKADQFAEDGCTLGHAIHAAEQGTDIGGCEIDRDTGAECGDFDVELADSVYVVTSPYLASAASLLTEIKHRVRIRGNGAHLRSDGTHFVLFQVVDPGELTLEGLTIEGFLNEAGPAVVFGSNGGLEVNDCEIRGNTNVAGTDDAGGGAIGGTWRTLKVDRSVFEGNTSSAGQGGAIRARCYEPDCIGASHFRFTETTFVRNAAHAGGGALSIEDALFELSGSVLASNRSVAGDGGAIEFSYDFDMGSAAEVVNTTMVDNFASGKGGGVYTSREFTPGLSGLLLLRHTTLIGNRCANQGCGLFADGAGAQLFEILLERSIVLGNVANLGVPDGTGIDCYDAYPAAGLAFGSHGGNWLTSTRCVVQTLQGTDRDVSGIIPFPPLADNGGPTHTVALPNVPAVCSEPIPVSRTPCEALDQRGRARDPDRCAPGAYALHTGHLRITSEGLTCAPATGRVGLRFAVERAGSSVAPLAPVVTVVAPPGFTLDTMTGTGFDCARAGTTATCTRRSMDAPSATFEIDATAPTPQVDGETWRITTATAECALDEDSNEATVVQPRCDLPPDMPPPVTLTNRNVTGGGGCVVGGSADSPVAHNGWLAIVALTVLAARRRARLRRSR